MEKALYLLESRPAIVKEDELKGRVVKPSSLRDPYHNLSDTSLSQVKGKSITVE